MKKLVMAGVLLSSVAKASGHIPNPLIMAIPLLMPDISYELEGDKHRTLLSYQTFAPIDCAPRFWDTQLKLAPLVQYQTGFGQRRFKYGGRFIGQFYQVKSLLLFTDWLLVNNYDRDAFSHQISAGVYLGPILLSLNQDKNNEIYRKSLSIGVSIVGFFSAKSH